LAGISGLRVTFVACETIHPESDSLTQEDKAMLACLLFAVIRFGAPCHIQDVKDNPTGVPIASLGERGIIIIDSRLAPNLGIFVQTLRHIGLPILFVPANEPIQMRLQRCQCLGKAPAPHQPPKSLLITGALDRAL
jgi:hypothetical protein